MKKKQTGQQPSFNANSANGPQQDHNFQNQLGNQGTALEDQANLSNNMQADDEKIVTTNVAQPSGAGGATIAFPNDQCPFHVGQRV